MSGLKLNIGKKIGRYWSGRNAVYVKKSKKVDAAERGRALEMKSIGILICTCFFCVELTCVQSTAGQLIFQSYKKPLPLPEFSLENLEGKTVNIRDYRGQVILLNFSATW
jgi:hypothetical protein